MSQCDNSSLSPSFQMVDTGRSDDIFWERKFIQDLEIRGFPGGTVVENLPANAGDTGLSSGLGRSHVPRSN